MKNRYRTTVLALGEHRGQPRIYMEGRWLIDAGFAPGSCYAIDYGDSRITITIADDGRSVSGKRNGAHAVIDLNCSSLRDCLGTIDRVTVHAVAGSITITTIRIDMRRAQRELLPTAVSMFSGGGLLSEAAHQAGFEILASVEINTRYADIYQLNHGGRMYNCSVEQVPWEQLAKLAPVGLLEMGIPCEPFSAIRCLDRGGQEKRNRDLPPEAHELGDMVYWAIKAADVLNPHTVIVEEVPRFLESGAGFILRLALNRMDYHVDARIIDPIKYGALTGRKRAVIVATTYEQIDWPQPMPGTDRRLGEILDDIPADSELWFNRDTKPWLYDHWQRQTERGNGFEPPKLTADSPSCPTIKKRYFAGQGDNPVVQHPDPRMRDHHRWLTLDEVRRLMGLPEDYDLGAAKTTAGEVLGQGVQVETFTRLVASVTRMGKEAGHGC